MELPNRIVMCSLSRCRAEADGVPTDMHAEYYSARASAGLIFTESSAVCMEGNDLDGSCPLYNDE